MKKNKLNNGGNTKNSKQTKLDLELELELESDDAENLEDLIQTHKLKSKSN